MVLASYRDPRCHASAETIRQALVGNDREEHIFALTQALEFYDVYQAKVALCDARIEAALKRLRRASSTAVGKPQTGRTTQKQSNDPAFDVRAALYGLLGCDVTQIHGLGTLSDAQIGRRVRDQPLGLAECQALHLLAVPLTKQQNLRRQSVVITDPTI
ncbi:hypothetical protein BHMPCIPO_03655 [Ensifer sesbaniae]|nr:hypothetical protein [Ensifer sesbaniae]